MCLDPATLAVAAKGAKAASGLLGFAQGRSNARAAKSSANERAKAETRQAIVDQEQFVRDERSRQSDEIASIAASGTSGTFGSPLLLAIENAGNSEINRQQAGQAAGSRIAGIRAQGQAQANQYKAQAIQSAVGAAQAGYGGYKGYKQASQNKIYLDGHTLPGVQ